LIIHLVHKLQLGDESFSRGCHDLQYNYVIPMYIGIQDLGGRFFYLHTTPSGVNSFLFLVPKLLLAKAGIGNGYFSVTVRNAIILPLS
jgi:hypothetical protein